MVPIATWEVTSNDDPFMTISLSIYCAGCYKDCSGCHSPALQKAENGKQMTAISIVDVIRNREDLIESVIFLGGEWLLYLKDLEFITKICHAMNKKTILYTGRDFLDLPQSLIEHLDIIIDGPYIEEQKTNYKIPASANQQIYVWHHQDSIFSDAEAKIEGYHVPVHPSQLPINREN